MVNNLVNKESLLVELFKRGIFTPFCTKDGKVHEKQVEALETLTDKDTREFGYGGAAGGAKSWTGCVWVTMSAKAFPDTRWFIGREELKRLRESTLITFFKVCREYGITGWQYNGQDHFIKFNNGSRIDLLDLKALPSDPLYERYGSIEYTGGWIEEGGEVAEGAYDTLKSRIGRQNNDKYSLFPKLFVTLNPKKNWCHRVFWVPFKEGKLVAGIKFLQAFVQDNPFIDPSYIESLRSITDEVRKQRLLYGNFDYDDDPATLIPYDKILDCFTNTFVHEGEKYITADIARFGSDSTVIALWDGYRCSLQQFKGKSVSEVAEIIKGTQAKEGVSNSNTIVDEDGVGGGVMDILKCKGFVNNSRALPNPNAPYTDRGEKPVDNFANLKSQCYYKLAEFINFGKLYIFCNDVAIKSSIIQELEQVKRHNVDKDGKQQVVPKDKVKEIIGRSPDFSDALMMRMWFEFAPKRVFAAAQY